MESRDNTKDLEIFAGSYKFFFIYKKTEKLLSAIYLVTNHISDSEPLKWSLRDTGNVLLESTLSFFSSDRMNLQDKSVIDLEVLFLKIISYTDTANLAGYISTMNHRIIVEEFKYLLKSLESYSKEYFVKNDVAFPEDFFSIDDDYNILQSGIKDKINNIKDRGGIGGGIAGNAKINAGFGGLQGNSSVNDTLYNSNTSSNQKMKDNKSLSKEFKKNIKNARRESILSVLKVRPEGLTIKDVVGVVKGCSEKTIQRELGEMIEEGLLKKEGERRWSRYFLLQKTA
ncbi:MAG: hypothetical protein Q7R78_02485 [bacterium]|nr:hypothetical protein [bacterium]